MFSLFVYFVCVVVSFAVSVYFWRAWKRSASANYWEFSAFFALMGLSFLTYIMPFALDWFVQFNTETLLMFSGFAGEFGNFLILMSFAFVLRAFIRFQGLSLSQNVISWIAALLASSRLVVGYVAPAQPVIERGLIYWHYSPIAAAVFGTLIIAFCFMMAAVFFANLKNIKENKSSIIILGSAFSIGGLSGAFITNSNAFAPLLAGYLLLLACFVLFLVFLLTPKRQSSGA